MEEIKEEVGNRTKNEKVGKSKLTSDQESEIGFSSIVGCSKLIDELKFRLTCLRDDDVMKNSVGIELVGNILVFGMKGTGKSTIIEALGNEANCSFSVISGCDIFGMMNHDLAEKRIIDSFKGVGTKNPMIIAIDDIDVLCSKENLKFANLVVSLIDECCKGKRVFIIATATSSESLDERLLDDSRFWGKMEINLPSELERAILMRILTKNLDLQEDVDLFKIASLTAGYSFHDICSLVTSSMELSVKELCNFVDLHDFGKDDNTNFGAALEITQLDFLSTLNSIVPLFLKKLYFRNKDILKGDVGGMDVLKLVLDEEMEKNWKYWYVYEKVGGEKFKGILLYGPSGCGKTMLMYYLASYAEGFVPIDGDYLLSNCWEDNIEKIRKLQASEKSIVLFFRESIELLTVSKDREKFENFLKIFEMENTLVICESNRPDLINPKILERIDKFFFVPLPSFENREKLLRTITSKVQLHGDVDLGEYAGILEGYTSEEICSLWKAVCQNAINESIILCVKHKKEKERLREEKRKKKSEEKDEEDEDLHLSDLSDSDLSDSDDDEMDMVDSICRYHFECTLKTRRNRVITKEDYSRYELFQSKFETKKWGDSISYSVEPVNDNLIDEILENGLYN